MTLILHGGICGPRHYHARSSAGRTCDLVTTLSPRAGLLCDLVTTLSPRAGLLCDLVTTSCFLDTTMTRLMASAFMLTGFFRDCSLLIIVIILIWLFCYLLDILQKSNSSQYK